MGNAAFLQCARGGRNIRVLLPDGSIELKTGLLDAADLMIEHVNHMVVHCSKSKELGGRPIMTILEPAAKLQSGNAYVIHPIPPQYKTAKISPQLSWTPNPHSNIGQLSAEDAERNQKEPCAGGCCMLPVVYSRGLTRTANRIQHSSDIVEEGGDDKGRKSEEAAKVSDSKSGPKELEGKQTSGVRSKVCSRQEGLKQANEALKKLDDLIEGGDDNCDILLNLNMYMGWRPALDSIPESPFGSKHFPPSPLGFSFRSEIPVQPICI